MNHSPPQPEDPIEVVPVGFRRDPFPVNPITWREYMPEQHSAAVEAAKDIRRTEPGGLVAMQLLWGSKVPAGHNAPFVLAVVPEDIYTNDMPTFEVYFCSNKGTSSDGDVGGKWTKGYSMQMHKQLLLCGGLAFAELVSWEGTSTYPTPREPPCHHHRKSPPHIATTLE